MVHAPVTRPPLRIALMLESDGPGGAEVMLLHLADELRRRGHAVVPVGPANRSGWLASQFRERHFEPDTFTLRSPIDWRCWRGLVALFGRHRIDVVHSHEFTMAVYGALAARSCGLRHVITMHGGRYYAEQWRRRVALRWAALHSVALVGVSDATAADLRRTLDLPPERVPVVPNGIPFARGDRAAGRARLGIPDTARLMLAVGNLYPVKGHDVLLRAFARVAGTEAGRAWVLAIAGRGECETSLRALAGELGIASRVHLLGFRSDVRDLLAAAELFVLPSRSEGLPLALIEAMVTPLPIVASKVGGIPEVVADGTEAVLAAPGDADALADALSSVMRDPVRGIALAHAAHARAVRLYGVEAMADRYETLYGVPPQRPDSIP